MITNCGTSVFMIEKYYSDALPRDFVDRLTRSRYPKVKKQQQETSPLPQMSPLFLTTTVKKQKQETS
jgi:hypothetical protein